MPLPARSLHSALPSNHTERFLPQPLPPAPPLHLGILVPFGPLLQPPASGPAWPPRTLLRPRHCVLARRGVCALRARAAVRPNIDAKSAPPGTEFGGGGGGGGGSADLCPSRHPRPLHWLRRRCWRGVPGPGPAEGCSRCDFTAEAWRCARAEAARAPEPASPGVRGVWGPGVRLRAPGHRLRPRAGRRCSPSCRCHQPAEAASGGAGPQGAAPPAAGKSSAEQAARLVRRPVRSVQSNFACVLVGCA